MKEVMVYTLTANSSGKPETNNILKFADVEEVLELNGELHISYTSKSTGIKNKAFFMKSNIAGYTIVG